MPTVKMLLGGLGSVRMMRATEDGDLLVVNAARCSFDKEHEMFDEVTDVGLINFLAREKHLLPFRHPHVTMRMELPIYILRQLGKHQVGFSWSEVSRRYITTPPKFHRPNFRKAAPNVKQGSLDELLSPMNAVQAEMVLSMAENKAIDAYNIMLDLQVAPEQARTILPQSMITTVVVTGSLLGWHFMVDQRTDPHTQKETQQYAHAIASHMRSVYPISWEALCVHSS
tara:strand:+ start:13472 stop:14152 length:681 start_codon:yes stop_codon:yes gene_type:complete